MPPSIPPDACFRRAEGLGFHVDPCSQADVVQVTASRQSGETQVRLSWSDVRLLSRLSRWQTATEVGAPHAWLAWLVAQDCAFWSPGRPKRELVGAPLAPLEGRVALRHNAQVVPLIHLSSGENRGIPMMPRRGWLDGAQLAGTNFALHEMEQVVTNVRFLCCARHAALIRDLVPLLDGSHDVAELTRDPAVAPLVAALNDLALLERHEPRRWDGEPRLTWLGHAGVLYEASGRRVLVDPVAFARSEPTRHAVSPVDLRDLGRLDAVLITHGDNDHFHPPLLHRLPRDTPIVIPRTVTPQPYQVDMERVLALLGFTRVVAVDEWQHVEVGEVTVVATPFRGEDWGLDLPCRTYVIDGPELAIYLNADSTATPEAYERIAREHRIDVAFVGVTGAAESHAMPPGFGYGNFYVKWIPVEKHNEWVELCNGPREAATAARGVGARFAFGYAAGGAPFYECSYSDRGTHAELARALAELPGAPRPIEFAVGAPTQIPR